MSRPRPRKGLIFDRKPLSIKEPRIVAEWYIGKATRLPNGCLISHRKGRGGVYPRASVEGKRVQLSRFIYSTLVGPIPEDLFILHSCDNPSCIAIEHLRLGTAKENTQDMGKRKGWTNQFSKPWIRGVYDDGTAI